MKIRIFTDGACSENPGPGGWAYIINTPEKCKSFAGCEKLTTNNRMELTAVVKSLEEIIKMKNATKSSFELYSDSAYVINSINNKWIKTWQKNGWKTTKREDVKNKDLWCQILILQEALSDMNINIKFIKIKGHSGNTFNELVDKLAREQSQLIKG